MLDSVENLQLERPPATLNGLPAPAIRSELERVLRSRVFVHSHRIRRFVQFVVEECLNGQQHRLKEYLIGLEVFNRQEAFDPRVDSIVRVEARRLRAKLEEYYQTEGRDAEVRIELRKGSYVPLFESRRPGTNAYGYSHSTSRRKSVAIGKISASGECAELAGEITRRLMHVLINEGYCQVIASPNPEADSAGQNAEYFVDGVLERHQNDVKIMLRLLNVAGGAYVWSITGDGESIEDMGRSLNRTLATSHATNGDGEPNRHRSHSQSFDHYLHGKHLWKHGSPEAIRGSVSVFTKTVEKDPSYAAAWASLSESLFISSLFGFVNPREAGPKIQEAAQRANALNDTLYEAHVALGLAVSIFEWKWQEGENELQRAVQLDGRDASVHVAYALQLACRGMMGPAISQIECALDVDPASLTSNFVLGWLRGATRKYDQAIQQHTLVSQLAPDFPLAWLGLGWAHAGKGLFPDALACFTNAANLLKCRTLVAGCFGFCYARMGNREEAQRLLAHLQSQPPNQFTSQVSVAAIHAGLGDVDRAFQCLEQAASAHDCALPLQLLNPEFESLKADARYLELLSRIGLLNQHIGFQKDVI